jgi:hypothetical protein
MDLNKFNDFKSKIEKRLNEVDAKISFLHDGVKGLSESHKGFMDEMNDFMSFIAEGLSDHENRIKTIEKKLN